jgi:hypothetical protein
VNTLLARGWATVELERAAGELLPLLAPGGRFEPALACSHLGARCLVGPAGVAGPVGGARFIVLLEPSTEGRLAVTLARHGETWCATWEADTTSATDATPGTDATSATDASAVRPGPFGPERLLLGGATSGPHRLVVMAATIAP